VDEPITKDGDVGGQDIVRAKVNGRRYFVDSESGKIVKGPPVTEGKYLSGTQLNRIVEQRDYYGHLFLADEPAHLRLKEAEFLLMEHKANNGQQTLVEGMTIVYNGMPGVRILNLTESAAELLIGNSTKKVSRERLEREASLDYENTDVLETQVAFTSHASDREPAGEIEIDDSVIVARVDEILESRMEELVDRLSKRLGNTLNADG